MTDKRLVDIKLAVEEAKRMHHEYIDASEYSRDAGFLLEEIESLRSQLEAINSHGPEGRNYTNAQYVEMLQKLQQAEQERDKYRAYVDTVNHDSEQVAIKATYQQIEIEKLTEANTAMREDIEQLIDDYDRRINSADDLICGARDDQKERAKTKRGEYQVFRFELAGLLSRYPKEGENESEQI